MSPTKKKRTLWQRMRLKYRITVYNYSTLEEVWSQNITRGTFFTLVGFIASIIALIVVILIIFTPIREFLPGYMDTEMKHNIIKSSYRIDSMENALRQNHQYLNNLKIIISGGVPFERDTLRKKSIDTKNIYFTKSKADSLFVSQIEQEERYNLSATEFKKTNRDINKLKFFPPLKGMVTNRFQPSRGHNGTDVVASDNNVICATLSGTVIFAEWTMQTGYVIQIQHENNLVSVYKHNHRLLKETGDFVKAGEVIAVFGNSGEQTTGSHLHFELWYNGLPVNPENFIVF